MRGIFSFSDFIYRYEWFLLVLSSYNRLNYQVPDPDARLLICYDDVFFKFNADVSHR